MSTDQRRQEYTGTNKLTAIKDAHADIAKLQSLAIKQTNVSAEQGKILRDFQSASQDLSFTVRALQKLSGFTEEAVTTAIRDVRIEDFDLASKSADEAGNFEPCSSLPTEKPDTEEAIVNFRFFTTDGVEMKNREIIRARIPLSQPEQFAPFVPTLLGMTVYDTRTIEEGTIKMQLNLVGARRKKPEPKQAG
jgi:hypothetical protein